MELKKSPPSCSLPLGRETSGRQISGIELPRDVFPLFWVCRSLYFTYSISSNLRETNPKESHLRVFSDASEKAYAAVYLVCNYHSGPPTSSLIAAKSRVSPIKAATIPRLELAGAALSTRVSRRITHVLSVATITFWTDSTNVVILDSQPKP